MDKSAKMNNITFKQYRNIDLTIFSIILVLSEAVTTLATNDWFVAQPIAISTTMIFICMVMMRWGGYAIIPAALGGLVFCIASSATLPQYLIYIVGNCGGLVSLLWFKFFKKEDVRKGPFKLTFFVITTYVSIQLARWVLSLPFGARPDTLLVYLGTDIISLLFAAVIMLIMRNVDGMIEDQKSYLFRLQREKEEQNSPVQPLGYGDED